MLPGRVVRPVAAPAPANDVSDRAEPAITAMASAANLRMVPPGGGISSGGIQDGRGAAIEVCGHCHRPARGPVAAGAQWLTWTQAASYCETTAVLFALASDAVPGLPAYTTPACPLALNGEPGAAAAAPGVTGLAGPHVFAGAPGWPVTGLTVAHAEAGAAAMKPIEQAMTRMCLRMLRLLGLDPLPGVPLAGSLRKGTARAQLSGASGGWPLPWRLRSRGRAGMNQAPRRLLQVV